MEIHEDLLTAKDVRSVRFAAAKVRSKNDTSYSSGEAHVFQHEYRG